ncbi:hypothetical protein S83_020333, partial [Arachis hypogaea]
YLHYCWTECYPRLSESAATLLQKSYVKIRQDMRQQANETGEATIPIIISCSIEERVKDAIRLFTVSTMDAVWSGIHQQIRLTPEMENEIKQAETQIKRRIGIGNHITERRLIDDLSRMGMNESIMSYQTRNHLLLPHQVSNRSTENHFLQKIRLERNSPTITK